MHVSFSHSRVTSSKLDSLTTILSLIRYMGKKKKKTIIFLRSLAWLVLLRIYEIAGKDCRRESFHKNNIVENFQALLNYFSKNFIQCKPDSRWNSIKEWLPSTKLSLWTQPKQVSHFHRPVHVTFFPIAFKNSAYASLVVIPPWKVRNLFVFIVRFEGCICRAACIYLWFFVFVVIFSSTNSRCLLDIFLSKTKLND